MSRPYGCPCGVCPTCRLYDTNAKYRAHWDKIGNYWTAPAKLSAMPRKFDCRFLGEATGETEECPSCQGTVKLKVFACGHEERGPVTTSKRCNGCPGYEAIGASV